MKKVIGIAIVGFALSGGFAVAQQTTPAPPPGPGAGHSMPPAMMCPMMGGMMSGAMMSGAQTDSPRMVQMRGEMLKAMGEVMLKYGKMMESSK